LIGASGLVAEMAGVPSVGGTILALSIEDRFTDTDSPCRWMRGSSFLNVWVAVSALLAALVLEFARPAAAALGPEILIGCLADQLLPTDNYSIQMAS
jgi:hypothetical protein